MWEAKFGGGFAMAFGKKIRLLIADDEPVARAGIRAILSQAGDIEVVGEAPDGFEAQRLVEELHPDIMTLDYQMPGPRPQDLERWVRENHPQTATLVLTAHDHDSHLAVMMEAGVAGYLKKGVPESKLVDSVRLAALGVVHFDREQIETARQWKEEVGQKWESLSKREREVLKLLAIGAGNRLIASRLSIAPKTVEGHITRILNKLGMSSCLQAGMWMVAHLPDEAAKNDW